MSQFGLPNGTKTGRGSIATPEIKKLWADAYAVYVRARGERRFRIDTVAMELGISRKVAKRRVKNYEGMMRSEGVQLPDVAEPSQPRSGYKGQRRFTPRGQQPQGGNRRWE